MELPKDLKITIPIDFDIDKGTAQILVHMLNKYIKKHADEYKLMAFDTDDNEFIEKVGALEMVRSDFNCRY